MSAQEVSVARYKNGKACATSFTFDDGNRDNFTIAAPELEKRGWRGTFWLNCSMIPGEVKERNHIMTWDDVCAMHAAGHEMSNHGWEHKMLTRLSLEQVKAEIEKNDSAIFVHTGVRPVTFCYAYNTRNEEIVELASKGRVGTRTFQYAFGEQSSDEQLRQRMDQAVEDGSWMVWMTHGITRGYDCFKDTSRYSSFLDYIKEHEDKIWVGTFKDVAAYIAERDAVVLSQTAKGRRICITTSLDLDPTLYAMPLTMCVDGVRSIKVTQDRKQLSVSYLGSKAYFDFDPHGGRIIIRL